MFKPASKKPVHRTVYLPVVAAVMVSLIQAGTALSKEILKYPKIKQVEIQRLELVKPIEADYALAHAAAGTMVRNRLKDSGHKKKYKTITFNALYRVAENCGGAALYAANDYDLEPYKPEGKAGTEEFDPYEDEIRSFGSGGATHYLFQIRNKKPVVFFEDVVIELRGAIIGKDCPDILVGLHHANFDENQENSGMGALTLKRNHQYELVREKLNGKLITTPFEPVQKSTNPKE
jgi:hypothetical protein